jgi:hypothetical protein
MARPVIATPIKPLAPVSPPALVAAPVVASTSELDDIFGDLELGDALSAPAAVPAAESDKPHDVPEQKAGVEEAAEVSEPAHINDEPAQPAQPVPATEQSAGEKTEAEAAVVAADLQPSLDIDAEPDALEIVVDEAEGLVAQEAAVSNVQAADSTAEHALPAPSEDADLLEESATPTVPPTAGDLALMAEMLEPIGPQSDVGSVASLLESMQDEEQDAASDQGDAHPTVPPPANNELLDSVDLSLSDADETPAETAENSVEVESQSAAPSSEEPALHDPSTESTDAIEMVADHGTSDEPSAQQPDDAAVEVTAGDGPRTEIPPPMSATEQADGGVELEEPSEEVTIASEPDAELSVEPAVEDEVSIAVAQQDEDEVSIAVAQEDEDGPEFVTDDEETTISIEEEEEAPKAAADDRGAQLAASVTSRRRDLEDSDLLYQRTARREVEERISLLLAEAAQEPQAARAADWLTLAGELTEGILGDQEKAKQLYEQALERDAKSSIALSRLRRIIAQTDPLGALELATREAELPLSEAEKVELDSLVAELMVKSDVADLSLQRWQRCAEKPDARGALASMFSAGFQRDTGALSIALEALGKVAQGSLAAAANLTRARLAEGAAEGDTALSAVKSAVQREPKDVGSWLALARIAITREDGKMFREAMSGLANAGGDSVSAHSALALDRATGAVLSDAIDPLVIKDPGVDGWLVAHALRDAGLNDSEQVAASREASMTATQLAGWSALGDSTANAGSPVAQLFALRRAVTQNDRVNSAQMAAELCTTDSVERAAVSAAMLSSVGALTTEEADIIHALYTHRPALAAVLAASRGADDSSAALGTSVWSALADSMQNSSTQDAIDTLVSLQKSAETSVATKSIATLLAAQIDGSLEARANAFRELSLIAIDVIRVAELQWLTAAVDASLGRSGAGYAAVEASQALVGDVGVTELVAIFGLRGEVAQDVVAQALEAAAGEKPSTASERMLAVRAALRRGGDDPEAAANALYAVWNTAKNDGALSALTLRALPLADVERRASVLRATAELAQAAATPNAQGAWISLAAELADGGKAADAAQAVARARATALDDPGLKQWEESLWLRAGTFEDYAERAFDALKSAERDTDRVAAYDKLAELDNTFRGDVASSVLTYQAILEIAPNHATALRVLERYFVEQGRFEELLGVYEKLAKHSEDLQDVTAIAHSAARVAIQQAEGDQNAGIYALKLAFARGAMDDRLLATLESEARRTGLATLFVDVLKHRAERATDPTEKSIYLTRAGEALLGLGQASAAEPLLDEATLQQPRNPSAHFALVQCKLALGAFAAAAEALENYAILLDATDQAMHSRLQAGILWQDNVNDAARARAVFDQILAVDPANAEAFPRALRALEALGDTAAERERIEARLGRGADKDTAVPLRLRASSIAEAEGDNAAARQHLRAALALEESQPDALRALIRLSSAAQDWPSVAEATIRLARVATDSKERNELLYSLGVVFDEHLNLAPKAETAYKRLAQLDPADRRPIERLANLYARVQQPANEAEMLGQWIARCDDWSEKKQLSLRLAKVLYGQLNRIEDAEKVLESVRAEAPTDIQILQAFAHLYIRAQRPEALGELLDNAAQDLRGEIDQAPFAADAYEHLVDVLTLRGRVDGAQIVAAIAHSVGVASEKLSALNSSGSIDGIGPNAVNQDVVDLLAPPTISTAHRELLRLGADFLERLVPFEPGAMRAEKLGARPHPMRAEIERWARIYQLESIEIYLGPHTPLTVLPVGRHPAAVLMPADLSDTPASRFAIARAMSIVALSLPLVIRLGAGNVTLLMAALLRQFDPMFSLEGIDMAKFDDLARRITRVLPRQKHSEMSQHAFTLIENRAIDGESLANGTVELANRIAVLAGGEISAAVRGLASPGTDLASQLDASTPVGRIVRVALSDRFMDARVLRVGSDP